MSTAENKALVQRFYEEIITQKNLAALDQFVSPTAVNHTVPAGLPQGPSQFLSMHLGAFPDLKASVVDLLADGDKVVALVSIHGTHQGAFRSRSSSCAGVATPMIPSVASGNSHDSSQGRPASRAAPDSAS